MRIDVDESFSLPFARLDFLAAGLLVSGALRCLFEDLPYSPYQLPSDFLLNLFCFEINSHHPFTPFPILYHWLVLVI